MSFAEQLQADIALIEPALEKYLSRETGEGYDRILRPRNIPPWRAESACAR